MTAVNDQWLDWGDHTIQIDPVGNKQWILESNSLGHSQSAARKRRYDRASVQQLIGWERNHETQHTEYFEPSRTLSGIYKYVEPVGKGCKQWRGQKRDESRFGQLPAITALLYENTLYDGVATGEIDHQMREWERNRDIWSMQIFS